MRRLNPQHEGDRVHSELLLDRIHIPKLFYYVRIRLSRAIRTDDRGKIRITKQQCMMALVGLEI